MQATIGQELVTAVQEGSLDKARSLLFDKSRSYFDSYWRDPNFKHDLDGAYMQACSANEEDQAKWMRLLFQEGLDPMALLDGGELDVLEASSEEATVFFRGWYRSMLQVDFSYCRRNWEGGKAPMDDAASAGMLDVVQDLLRLPGTSVNNQDMDGYCALHDCLQFPHLTRTLLIHPAINTNLPCKEMRTPVMTAVLQASELQGAAKVPFLQSLQLLLNHPNTDVNFKDKNGWTAMMWACERRDHDSLAMLLSHARIDVNARDHTGCTALMMACDVTDSAAVGLLLRRNDVDVNLRNLTRQTALDVAYEQSENRIIEMLESKGASTRMSKKAQLRGSKIYRTATYV